MWIEWIWMWKVEVESGAVPDLTDVVKTFLRFYSCHVFYIFKVF